MRVGVAYRRPERRRDAGDIARLALAGDVAQGIGVDHPVAIEIVVGAHELGEVIGALESLLPRVFAHPVVHLCNIGQESGLHVHCSAGRGVLA